MLCATFATQISSWIAQNSLLTFSKTCSYSRVSKHSKLYDKEDAKQTDSVCSLQCYPSYIDRMMPMFSLLNNNTEIQATTLPAFNKKYQHLLCQRNPVIMNQIRNFRARRTEQTNKEKSEEGIREDNFFNKRIQNLFNPSKKTSTNVNEIMKQYNIDSKQASIVKLGYEEGVTQANKKPIGKYIILLAVCVGLWFYLKPIKVSSSSFTDIMKQNKDYLVEHPDVTFSDVKGIDEVKDELENIVDFLKDPDKYCKLGGRLPKGILLVGSPGTGKTLLAKAIAGEANVPFYYASGAEFDEMFVGVGSSRIRKLFKDARESSPCIIFIDEIDACGNKRSNSAIQPYARQTINQLLQEMDGFTESEGVIVLGATNTVSVLDKALRRPGRFDQEIHVMNPDIKGRKEILELYVGKTIHDGDIDLEKIARLTGGMTGAELESLVNQAAIQAARLSKLKMTMADIDYALNKIRMGTEVKGKTYTEEELKNTAFHEAGHAIAAYFTPKSNPIFKASIRQRGQTLGHVSFVPQSERNQTKDQLLGRIDVDMAGRVAEELIFGEGNVTTGASSDLVHATNVAKGMVLELGMGKNGYLSYDMETISEAAKHEMEAEVNAILNTSYQKMKDLLSKRQREHNLIANALLKYETIDLEEIKAIIETNDLNVVDKIRKAKNAKALKATQGIKPPVIEFMHPIREK